MIKLVPLAIIAAIAIAPVTTFAAEANQQVREANAGAAAAVSVAAGKMLYGPTGSRIASIYRVTSTGDVQIILDGKLRTISASTLSEVDGKVATSLSKQEIGRR